MNTENYISLNALCVLYKVEMTFFIHLKEMGLIEFLTIEESPYISPDKIDEIEKIIRMHHELDVNVEGIDVVFNLLQKIDSLQNELTTVKNRLRLYEK